MIDIVNKSLRTTYAAPAMHRIILS